MADYVFYNNNPDLLIENDCVTRAISLASGLPYEVIEEKLYLTSKLFECPKLCVCCYENLLNYVFNYEQIYGVEGNYVVGANIAGFEKVVDAMTAQGIV